MRCESSLRGGQRRAHIPLRWPVSRSIHLSVMCLGYLLCGALALAGAGDGPIPIVEVKLREFAIEMPLAVPIGPVVFSVTNGGTMDHNFEVEGQGLEERFDTNLKPGETRDLPLDLAAGTYTVYCPVDDHKARGMQVELKVAEQRSE